MDSHILGVICRWKIQTNICHIYKHKLSGAIQGLFGPHTFLFWVSLVFQLCPHMSHSTTLPQRLLLACRLHGHLQIIHTVRHPTQRTNAHSLSLHTLLHTHTQSSRVSFVQWCAYTHVTTHTGLCSLRQMDTDQSHMHTHIYTFTRAHCKHVLIYKARLMQYNATPMQAVSLNLHLSPPVRLIL